MITELLLEVLMLSVNGIAALVPDWAFPWQEEAEDAAAELGDQLAFLDGIFPVHETAGALSDLLGLFVGLIVLPYVIARWIVGHLPGMGDS